MANMSGISQAYGYGFGCIRGQVCECIVKGAVMVGDDIQHKIFGSGKVEAVNEKSITIYFESKKFTKKFGLSQVLANAIVSFDKEGFMDKVEEYMDVLKDASLIPKRLEIAVHSLEPYEEYL